MNVKSDITLCNGDITIKSLATRQEIEGQAMPGVCSSYKLWALKSGFAM